MELFAKTPYKLWVLIRHLSVQVKEDLKGSDKEDMQNLVVETEQLLTECSKKYDHEQYR